MIWDHIIHRIVVTVHAQNSQYSCSDHYYYLLFSNAFHNAVAVNNASEFRHQFYNIITIILHHLHLDHLLSTAA